MSKSPKSSSAAAPASNHLQRRAFVTEVLSARGDALVVPGLGSATWDLFAAGDTPANLYSWGGMGLAVPTALGLAMAQPSRRVLALTGDGEIMMGIGSLGVAADQAPRNLAILVLDNERFSETGRQRGLTGNRVDLCAVAKGFGIRETMLVTEASAIPALQRFLFEAEGPVLAVAKIALSEDPWRLPEKDGAAIGRRFKIALGLEKP